MKLHVFILCALLAGGTFLRAESGDSKHASLQGRVVKEPGGEPINQAIIELIQDTAESANNYTPKSDVEGNFEILDTVPGRYHILVDRTGYVFVDAKHHRSEAEAISLESGQSLTDQLFRMLPTAVLTGRVLDEDGDPMPDANVTVMRRVPSTSGRTEEVAGERTNDVGQYRISGIMPGRYLIHVTPPIDLANSLPRHTTENAAEKTKAELAYVPTYYPNTLDRSQAGLIDLHAGDEVPIDFFLARVPTAHIRGTVADLLPGAQAVVVLRSSDGMFAFNEVQVEKDGRFELPKVAPGSYSLVAIEQVGEAVRVGRQTEEVRAANIDGIRLVPLRASTIRGQVYMQGRPHSDFSKIFVFLQPSQGDAATINLPARINPSAS